MKEKNQFASKIGLVATTVGSAVGLGNVWRFPAETQMNGGAAFLLLYVACVVILGIPVMLAEFSLGRAGKSDAIGVFRNLSPGKKWWIIGVVAVIAPYLITCYYMVVEGWTLQYLWQSITGNLYEGIAEGEAALNHHALLQSRMNEFIFNGWNPVIAVWVVIAVNLFILLGGVQKGIERLSNIMMPVLFAILVFLAVVTLMLPQAAEGLKFFLSPDFSKLTPQVFVNALGQTFFSLSLGMGILVTYASYYPANTHLTKTAVIVNAMSILVAVLMGFIIFPAVMSFGLDKEPLEGATLVFITLPEVFAEMSLTRLWSSLFFLMLLVAALTSTISLLEVIVRFLQETAHLSRKKACLAAVLPLFLFSAVCAMSFGPLAGVKLFGLNIFDLLDNFATNILLPLVAIATCVYVGWFAPKKMLQNQLTNNGTLRGRGVVIIAWILRFVAPLLIVAILLSKII